LLLHRYRKELLSGHLDWTPAHRSRAFWVDNVNKFSDNDFMALKSLIVVLQSEARARCLRRSSCFVLCIGRHVPSSCRSADKDKKTTPTEIAVVLNDLAMFMKFHSNGTVLKSSRLLPYLFLFFTITTSTLQARRSSLL
jgi:hypothetical protein